MVERALLWGLEALELQIVGGPTERVPYVNEARLRRRLEESELAVSAINPGIFEGDAHDRASWMNDLALLDESLAFCSRVSCRIVVVSSFMRGASKDRIHEALRRAGDKAAKHGVELALVNETGMNCETGSELAGVLGGVAHPAVGAAWDPGVAANRENPDSTASIVAEHAVLVRYSTGSVGWDTILDVLASRGFAGPVSLVLPAGTGRGDGLSVATEMIGRIRATQSPRPT